VNLSNFPILSLALRALLADGLRSSPYLQDLPQSIYSVDASETATASAQSLHALFEAISLNRIQSNSHLEYVSALAFKLAASQQQSAVVIAEAIEAGVKQMIKRNQIDWGGRQFWQKLSIWVDPPGWIHLRLSEAGLAEWLQYLLEALPDLSETTNVLNVTSNLALDQTIYQQTNFFRILHAHARCCSLLRLAAQENLIQINLQINRPGYFVMPQPLSWIERDWLRCREPQELMLIAQICDALDFLAESEALNSSDSMDEKTEVAVQAYKTAERLSQAFHAFHANCRIWENIRLDRPLAEVRLGLVLITQATLRLLLKSRLSCSAPVVL
jgi:arginyl-tRNA synthetase